MTEGPSSPDAAAPPAQPPQPEAAQPGAAQPGAAQPEAAQPEAAQTDPFVSPVPPPAVPVGPGDPNRHFDGQQWLVWDGTAWVPEAPVPPPSTGGRRTLLIVVAVVVVALVAGGAFVASKVMNAEKPIVVPTSLGGLAKSTDASITAQADQLRTSLGQSIHGAKFDVGAYGGQDAGAIAILVAARNGGSADEFFSGIKSSGLDVSDATKVGDSSCVTAATEQVTICLRTSSGLMVAVVLSGTDQGKAAGMVDEAWGKQ
jgi:hypothetical protein